MNPYYDTSEITDLMKTSNMFVLRAHGSPTSFVLNAKDGNGSFIGSTTTYNISLINNMNSSALNNLKCALFLSCSSAEDSYSDGSSASNFVTAVVDRGARSAIGSTGRWIAEEPLCSQVISLNILQIIRESIKWLHQMHLTIHCVQLDNIIMRIPINHISIMVMLSRNFL